MTEESSINDAGLHNGKAKGINMAKNGIKATAGG